MTVQMDAKSSAIQEPTVKSGQVITETFSMDEDVNTRPAILISQEPFNLTEADFLRIKGGRTKASGAANGILLTSLGMAFILLLKYLQAKASGGGFTVQVLEWLAPAIGLGIASLLYLLDRILPNEKKQVMRDIENHFSEAPRTRHLVERKET